MLTGTVVFVLVAVLAAVLWKRREIPWERDRWFGEDKMTHATYCYAGGCTAIPFVGIFWAFFLVAIAAAVVEVIQWARYDAGETVFAAPPSYRDLAWDGIGFASGCGILLLHGLVL